MNETTCPLCGGYGETGGYFQLDDGSIDDDIRPCELCGGLGAITTTEKEVNDVQLVFVHPGDSISAASIA